MDLQGFPSMTSYSSKLETGVQRRGGISSPDSRSRSYTKSLPSDTHNTSMPHTTSFSQDHYSNTSTPVQNNPPRYPESSQRTLNNYGYHSSASYLGELAGDDVHTNPSEGEPRYPSSTETADTYPSNINVQITSNLPSTSLLHQHGTDGNISNYRSSLRAYPSQGFQQSDFDYRRSSFQPLLRDDLHYSTINGSGFSPANQTMSHSNTSRRNSATSDRILHSPVSPSQAHSRIQHRHNQHHQQHYVPYTSSISSAKYTTSYSSSSAGSRTTHSGDNMARPYQTHVPSSIPMSNPPPQDANEKHVQASLNHGLANTQLEYQNQQYQSPRELPTDNCPSFVSAQFDRPAISHSHSLPDLRVHSTSHASLGLLKSIHSPVVSDNDSAAGSDYAAAHDDDDDDYERYRGGRGTGSNYSDGKLRSFVDNSKGRIPKRSLTMDRETSPSVGGGDTVVDGGGAVKKKKKSKMHECAVCHKKFPRPSGLKTHMNTHNNERPFSCGFPGCPRTFGVRSNAKRHLRTHGVLPEPASTTRTQPPYIVGFEPPVIFPRHHPGQALPDDIDGRAPSSRLHLDGVDGKQNHDGSGYEHDMDGASAQAKSDRPLKLKWMPLSLISHVNTSSLREVGEGDLHSPDMVSTYGGHAASSQWLPGDPWNEVNDEDYYQDRRGYAHRPGSDNSSRDIEYALSTDYERGPHSDMAAASRLSIPLRPPCRSRSEEHFSRDSDSMLGASSLSSPAGGCHCNPLCPRDASGLSRCRSDSSLGGSPVASGSSSFLTPSGIDSTSPRMMSRDTFAHRKLNILELEGRATSSGNDDRNQNPPYLEPGSYPYRRSQFHGLPGPAATSVVVLPRPYMMV